MHIIQNNYRNIQTWQHVIIGTEGFSFTMNSKSDINAVGVIILYHTESESAAIYEHVFIVNADSIMITHSVEPARIPLETQTAIFSLDGR